VFAATVTATFFASSSKHTPAKQANTIIPISTLSNTSADDASVPPAFSVGFLKLKLRQSNFDQKFCAVQLNVTLPQNAVQVFAEIYASGNGAEEFWVPNSCSHTCFPLTKPIPSPVLQRRERIHLKPPTRYDLWSRPFPRSATTHRRAGRRRGIPICDNIHWRHPP